MRDAGILDGDQVIMRKQSTASDGDIVVATLDGETTLKRLRIAGRRATLVAENPAFEPIEMRSPSAIIQGVIVGLQRAYRAPARSEGRPRTYTKKQVGS
jgi:SOS-response transcriptional repressor LexA